MSGTSTDTSAPQTNPPSGVRIRIFGRTDVGSVREHNEDNFLVADLSRRLRNQQPEVRTHVVGPRGTLFAVCDGMGGAAAGEVASQMAVDTIYELVQSDPPPADRDQFAQRLVAAIHEAGARIYLAAKSNRAQRGMGTTSTVAGIFGQTLFVGQVGDSRAYLLRNGQLKQITKDQSLVSKLIEAGQLTEEEAEKYEHSHIILQALGTSDSVSVDLSFIELRQGDTILLCSDGLSGLVSAEQIREVLTTIDEPMECCKRLTELALNNGGHDNITVIVARVDGDLPPPDDAPFGYQPYVIRSSLESEVSARASDKIKDADAPPPGKDVKHAASIRPPPMAAIPPQAMQPSGVQPAPMTPAGDDDLQLPVSHGPRTALAIVLIVLALGVLGTAAIMLLRDGRGGSSPTPSVQHASTANASPLALVPDATSLSTPIAAPPGWTAETVLPMVALDAGMHNVTDAAEVGSGDAR